MRTASAALRICTLAPIPHLPVNTHLLEVSGEIPLTYVLVMIQPAEQQVARRGHEEL